MSNIASYSVTRKSYTLLYQDEYNDFKIILDKATGEKTVIFKKMKCTCGKNITGKKMRVVLEPGQSLTVCHKNMG